MQDPWFSWVRLAHGPVSERDKLQIPLEEKQYINRKGKDGNIDHRNNLGDSRTWRDREG